MSTLRTNTLQTTDSAFSVDIVDLVTLGGVISSDPGKGSALVPYKDRTVEEKLDELVSVYDLGALDGVDSSAALNASISTYNYIYIPLGRTVIAKNIQLFNNSRVICEGTLKLPDGCVDFDRLLYAAGKSDISLRIKNIDGNSPGQAGAIGTHLIYLTNCVRSKLDLGHVFNHYYPTNALSPSVDGIRDTSSGPIFLYQDSGADVKLDFFFSWGRECVQLRECTNCTVQIGHLQGVPGGPEYSGLQVSGSHNKVLCASVDQAGASGVGFDTTYGILSNIISTNTRENHGVNFGHPGFPATGSIATNIIVDGAYRHGIQVGASTQDLSITNFSVSNAGELGVSISDSATNLRVTSGKTFFNGQANLSTLGTNIDAVSVTSTPVDAGTIKLTGVTGTFVAGETVTSAGASGVVRKVLKDRTGAGQTLLLSSVTGTFVTTNLATGGTSGAIGVINTVLTPAAQRLVSGGTISEDSVFITGGLGEVTKFRDGTCIFRHTVTLAVLANTLTQLVVTFPTAAGFVATPKTFVNISSPSSTNAYTVARCDSQRTSTNMTVNLQASVAQTYGLDVEAVGRWK